jgi:hypothetical protein
MANIKVEISCNDCCYEAVPGPNALSEHNSYECPKCGSRHIQRYPYVECECGDYVYLINHTNQCECGKLYNGFGQELADPSKWDEEDRYGTFGPLTDPLDYME